MSKGSLDLNAITSSITLFTESNNSSTLADENTPGRGVFVSPSPNVPGRPVDITGYFLVASNEEGKLEYNSGENLLTLDDLNDVSINDPLKSQYLCYNGTEWVNDYVDSTISWKPPVKVATTQNIVLDSAQTIDGVTLVEGDRVLVKDQLDAVENGIYDVVETGPWTRSSDFVDGQEASCDVVCVEGGFVSSNSLFKCITPGPNDIVGTDPIEFQVFGGGDVNGPLFSTDNAIARWDTSSGKLLQNSSVTIDDSGNLQTSGEISGNSVVANGSFTIPVSSTFGLFGVTPVSQQASVSPAPTQGIAYNQNDVNDIVNSLNDLIVKLQTYGIIA